MTRTIVVVGLVEVVTSLSFRATRNDAGSVIDVRSGVVVVCNRIGTTCAAAIVVGGAFVIVVGTGIGTTGNLRLVTDTIKVGVVQTTAITIKQGCRRRVAAVVDVGTKTKVDVVIRELTERIVRIDERVVIVVTRLGIGTSVRLLLVADAIIVGIVQAVAVAIEVRHTVEVNRVLA